jgi:sugar O-acyltransferase (sialic acid O-acetyltransferase NeuD family)
MNHVQPELILIGGGGHCAACIDVIETIGSFRIAGIIDSDSQLQEVCGYPVLGNDSMLPKLRGHISHAFVCIGQIRDASLRMRMTELLLSQNYTIPSLVSPRAYVSKHARIGAGSIIMHDVLINARATIGQHCIINSKALIEHDAVIEDFCHISTAAVINGGTHIRRGTFFGSNAASKELAVCADNDFIKAGTLFTGKKND